MALLEGQLKYLNIKFLKQIMHALVISRNLVIDFISANICKNGLQERQSYRTMSAYTYHVVYVSLSTGKVPTLYVSLCSLTTCTCTCIIINEAEPCKANAFYCGVMNLITVKQYCG